MGLFGKRKEPKLTTLMTCIWLFEDFDHQRPDKQSATPFAEEIMIEVVRKHYYEALRPPKNWNYDYDIKVISNMTGTEMERYDFRDPNTKAIVNEAAYREVCSAVKTTWKTALKQRFPKYDSDKFEDGFEDIKFTYSPERCTLTASILFDDIMKAK